MMSDTTKIKISGFRSLTGFEIDLNSGINVLVGPNGSGKTNFIDFLNFISNVVRHGAATAVSSVGGVSRAFSIEAMRKSNPCISVKIEGTVSFDKEENFFDEKAIKRGHCCYSYELKIVFSKKDSVVYLAQESLTLKKCVESRALARDSNRLGTISIERGRKNIFGDPTISVSRRLYSKNPKNPFAFSRRPYGRKELKQIIDEYWEDRFDFDQSFLSKRSPFFVMDAIAQLIRGAKAFNIDPNRARQSDDLVAMPVIGPDGSGLTSTLFHIQNFEPLASRRRVINSRIRLTEFSFQEVVSWVRIVLPQIKNLKVSKNLHTGKYTAEVELGDRSEIKVPFQSLSDGTIKWICFVTLMVASGNISSIEEPENFLHPAMQEYMVQILRENLQAENNEKFFIVSTHSETLINQFRPEELVIFSYEEGITVCKRLSDPMAINQSLSETGFGLGYYYVTNSLS